MTTKSKFEKVVTKSQWSKSSDFGWVNNGKAELPTYT